MENYSYHVPFFVVDATAGVATSGHSSDLAKKQVGLFDRQNFSVATSGGSGTELFLAQGVLGGKDWYGNPITASSHKSPFFRVSDIEDIYVSLPQQAQNEEWIIGYNGAVGSKSLSFEKEKALRIKFYFYGQAVYRFFGGPKEYVVSYTPAADCVTPCDAGDCAEALDCKPHTKALIDEINNHIELSKFGVKATLISEDNTVAETGNQTSTRTMKITLVRNADGTDRLGEFADWVGGIDGVNIGTLTKIAGAGNADEYTVTQDSYEETPAAGDLSSTATFHYHDLPAIEGVEWVDVTTPETESLANKCGIRVSAAYLDPKFGDCSFNPDDYYQTEPIRFEVSLLQEDGSKCDIKDWPSVIQTKQARIARQSGEYVIRQVLMKTDAYQQHMKQFSLDTRMREAFDMNLLGMVDRNAFYKLYYIRFKASYANSWRKNEQEKFTAVFAVKTTDTTVDTALNTNVIDVLETKAGITMHVDETSGTTTTTTTTTSSTTTTTTTP